MTTSTKDLPVKVLDGERDVIITAFKAVLNEAVAKGEITAERNEAILKRVSEVLTALVTGYFATIRGGIIDLTEPANFEDFDEAPPSIH